MSLSANDKLPQARLCHVVKWESFDGYGFNLHAEKGKGNGQYIGKVDEGSPSEAAGLKQGDRIVEVNEINITNEKHQQVVERIKAFPNETKLLVVDQEADEYFKANGIPIKGDLPNIKYNKTPEKNPHIKSDDTTAPSSVDQEEKDAANNYAASVGSNGSSIDEVAQKSISSTDSNSTAPAVLNNNSGIESRENGSRIENNSPTDKNGTTANGNGNGSVNMSGAEQKSLNLKMSAKELRAQLAARKKFDPKKESMDFKSKFDIVQKL